MTALYEDDNIKIECNFNGFPVFRRNFYLLLSENQKMLFTELGSNCYSFIDYKRKKEIAITVCNIDFYMETFTFPYREQSDYDQIISYLYKFF